MDGQRRIAQPVKRNKYFRRDCPSSYRLMARGAAVLFLGASLLHGIVSGGHLDYPGSVWLKIPGRMAGFIGMAADDIQVSGLQHHDARDVLASIGVKPGGQLLGFDAARARDILQQQDWVEQASVQRRFPNQLVLNIVEREPFVVWQHGGQVDVVDKKGKPMGGLDPASVNVLLHVTGAGANIAAPEFVNQIEAVPELRSQLKAAARVGERRWTLYLNDGLKIALPETQVEAALKNAEGLLASSVVRQKAVSLIDMRVQGEVSYQVMQAQAEIAVENQAQ